MIKLYTTPLLGGMYEVMAILNNEKLLSKVFTVSSMATLACSPEEAANEFRLKEDKCREEIAADLLKIFKTGKQSLEPVNEESPHEDPLKQVDAFFDKTLNFVRKLSELANG